MGTAYKNGMEKKPKYPKRHRHGYVKEWYRQYSHSIEEAVAKEQEQATMWTHGMEAQEEFVRGQLRGMECMPRYG